MGFYYISKRPLFILILKPGWSGTTRSALFGVPTVISVPKGKCLVFYDSILLIAINLRRNLQAITSKHYLCYSKDDKARIHQACNFVVLYHR